MTYKPVETDETLPNDGIDAVCAAADGGPTCPDPIREKALAMAISVGGHTDNILQAAEKFERYLRGETA